MGSVKSKVHWWLISNRDTMHFYDLDLGWTFVLDFQTNLFFWSLRQ